MLEEFIKSLLNFKKHFKLDILHQACPESCLIEYFGCIFL